MGDSDGSFYECEGINGGTLYTTGNGNYYAMHVTKRNDAVKYLRCKYRHCRGGAKIVKVGNTTKLIELNEHTKGCVPDLLFERMVELRRNILGRAEQEITPLAKIFNQECKKVPPKVAATLTLNQIMSAMKRARKRYQAIPSDFSEYASSLEERFTDNFYFERVGKGDEECIVFVVEPIKHILEKAKELHLDGTFRIVPKAPSSTQLFSILAMKNDHEFPVVFCLMKTKTVNTYCAVLNLLKQRYPEMAPNLIITEYEADIKDAVKQVFPQAIHKGCWLHYVQCIVKKLEKLGLMMEYTKNKDVEKAVGMLVCLAFLPEHLIGDAFTHVETFCRGQNVYDKLREIFEYFRSQWIETVGSSSFSVYGHPRRTNNCQQRFHHMLFAILGKVHPNIWQFTEALKTVADTAIKDSAKLESHGVSFLGNEKKWILQDMVIRRAQEELVAGRITPIDFLCHMAHHVPVHIHLKTLGDEEEHLASLPDPLPPHSVPLEGISA